MNSIIVNLQISVLTTAAMILFPLPTCAQESDAPIGEDQVKSSIEEIAQLYICSDQSLLESSDIDPRRCQIGASTFADACWKIVDKLVPDYSLTKDEQGKERFDNIADVYIHCVQAKLLVSLLEARKKSAIE